MSIIVLSSVAIRAVAHVIALELLRRQRDWRLVFLVAMIAFMMSRQTLTLIEGPGFGTFSEELTELPGLIVSGMVLLAVIFLSQLLSEREQLIQQALDRQLELVTVLEQARQTEQRLRTFAGIIESSSEVIGTATPEGRVTYVNPAGCKLLGLEPAQVEHTTIRDYYLPEDYERVEHEVLPSLAATGFWQGELQFRHFQTGQPIPMYQSGYAIAISDGGDGRVLANISHDISARQRQERALRESEGRLRAIMDHAPMDILLVNRAGKIEFANKSSVCGVEFDTLVGRPFLDVVPNAHRGELAAALQHVLETGDDRRLETRGLDQAGMTCCHDCHLARVDSAGQPDRAIFIALNISVRQQAESALRESEARFRAMCEASPVGIFLTDPEGNVTYCNPSDQQQTGLTWEGTMGRRWLTAIHPDDRERVLADFLAAVNTQTPFRGVGRYLHDNGNVFWWDVKTAPVTVGDELIGYVGICTDITERRYHEEERSQRFAQLQKLADASRLLSSSASLEERLTIITEQGRAIIGAHQCVTSLSVDNNWNQAIHSLSLSDKYADWQEYDVKPDGTGIYMLVCRTNKPIRLTQDELEAHPAWKAFGAERERHPPMRGWLAAPLIDRHGNNLGIIQLSDKLQGDFTPADEAILVQLAGLASAGIESARLFEQVVEARERLAALTRQLMTAQETERRHLARELHDEIGQILTAININLQQVKGKCEPQVLPRVEESMAIVTQAIQQVRDMSLNLRPAMLDDFGLEAALRWYLERQQERGQCDVRFESRTSGGDLPSDVKNACFRVTQEALTNVFRHAQATKVLVTLREADDAVILSIRDNGVGFDQSRVDASAMGVSFGLRGMQERVELLGGEFCLESSPGHGTCIQVALPLPAAAPIEESHEEVAPT
ncbi:MAG: PAS domain S-box protein [Gemmataceae bacterium]